ncbi:MAG: hypothetical protein Q4E55_07395 [Bacteroidales bacterium]|nr:hypothetical protein [Bacteroidales bacterium]
MGCTKPTAAMRLFGAGAMLRKDVMIIAVGVTVVSFFVFTGNWVLKSVDKNTENI